MEHHSAQKKAVLATLVQWACKLCDAGSLREKLQCLKHVFEQNGIVTSDESYNKNRRQSWRTRNPQVQL